MGHPRSNSKQVDQGQIQETHVRLLCRTNMGHPEVKSRVKS